MAHGKPMGTMTPLTFIRFAIVLIDAQLKNKQNRVEIRSCTPSADEQVTQPAWLTTAAECWLPAALSPFRDDV